MTLGFHSCPVELFLTNHYASLFLRFFLYDVLLVISFYLCSLFYDTQVKSTLTAVTFNVVTAMLI